VSNVKLNSTVTIDESTGNCQIANCQIANCQIANCQIASGNGNPFANHSGKTFANHSGKPKSESHFDPETRHVSGS
jgi:hypothetical protein